MEKLTIQNEMACFDLKDRDFYDNLTTEERKKFSNFLMIRWGSSIQGDREIQEYYVRSCNHYLNKHFFAINRHPKLQWLGATAVSPGLGTHRHIWISPKKKEAGGSVIKKALMQMYPAMKMSDIEAMSTIVDKKEIQQYLRDHGHDDK
jgi:hypothetical protein